MDWLIFWVTVGILFEGTRAVLKWCTPHPDKEHDLLKPLLKSAEFVDASDSCTLQCCGTRRQKGLLVEEDTVSQEQKLLEETLLEIAGGKGKDVLVPILLTGSDTRRRRKIKGKEISVEREAVDSLHDILVTGSDRRRRTKIKGKEIAVERERGDSLHDDLNDEIANGDLVRSDIVHSTMRKEGRRKSSMKVYPEPLRP